MNKLNNFIKRAREIHGDYYIYGFVNYKTAREKVCIICPIHGAFWQTPNKHLSRGQGCSKCARDKVSEKFRSNTDEFTKKSKQIHRDKYDYSLVRYMNSKTKVCIICPEHGEFWQRPNGHLNGQGCPHCSIEQVAEQHRYNTKEFIKHSREVHGCKFNYDLVAYFSSESKVSIICNKHGLFWQTPGNHINNRAGCPRCSKTGLNPDAPAFLYVLTDNLLTPTILKIGVTNNLNKRLSQLKYSTPFKIFKLISYSMITGRDAYHLEQKIHRVFKNKNAGLSGFSGATEWFNYSPDILDYVRYNHNK